MRFGPFRLDINLQIERFAASVGHSNFIDTLWNLFRVAVRISSFLDTFSRCRLSFVSSTVYFDSIETSLGVTEILEQVDIRLGSSKSAVGDCFGRSGCRWNRRSTAG